MGGTALADIVARRTQSLSTDIITHRERQRQRQTDRQTQIDRQTDRQRAALAATVAR